MDGFTYSNILEVLERSIWLRLLDTAVSMGYTPDINDATLYPNTPAGQIAYQNALKTIRTNKGFAIEVFGNSGVDAKGDKEDPRIVLISEQFQPGEIGMNPDKFYVLGDNGYEAFRYPSRTSKFFYRVMMLGSKTTHFRILNGILSVAIPIRGYVSSYLDPTVKYYNERTNYMEYDDAKAGIFERAYRYFIDDVFEVDLEAIETGIAPIESIQVNFFNPTKKIEEWNITYTQELLASDEDQLASDEETLITH